MYKLFLKIATRHLLKNKLYSFINIIGLAIGIASFVLIMLYVNYERSYDKFEGSENVYRTYMDYFEGNAFVPGDAQTYNLSGPSLKKEFPEVLDYVRFFYFEKMTFQLGEHIMEQPLGSLADPSYFDIFNYPLLKGSKGTFLPSSDGKGRQVVVNETFLKTMGFSSPDEKLNKTLGMWGNNEWKVTGVIKDYYHFGLKSPKLPMIIRYQSDVNNLLVKLDSSSATLAGFESSISQIKSEWTRIFPQSTFNYTFLDQKFEAQYKEDKAFGSAFKIFTFLAIFIASMGLFGLTSYTIIQRKKEIGIRKVNGATIGQVLKLLNKDFVKWVGFAYRTTLSWWVFALAGITALLIALLTVSWQSFRAAIANPVDALRNE